MFIDGAGINCPDCPFGKLFVVVYENQDKLWYIETTCDECDYNSGPIKKLIGCEEATTEEIFTAAQTEVNRFHALPELEGGTQNT